MMWVPLLCVVVLFTFLCMHARQQHPHPHPNPTFSHLLLPTTPAAAQTTYGATTGTYNEAATGVHTHEHGVTHHQTVDEVIEERPVAVGVAEVRG